MLDGSERAGRCLPAVDESLSKALERRRQAGLLVRPRPQLYVRESVWEELNPAAQHLWVLRGIACLKPDTVFCGISAAVAHGLQVPYAELDGSVQVATSSSYRQRAGSGIRFQRIDGLEPVRAGGLLVTPLERTVFDCMRVTRLRHAVAVADSALRRGGIPKEGLAEYVGELRGGYRGAARAREACALADPRSMNGGESVARVTMHELGFLAPDLQVGFVDPVEPWRRYYVDFAWRFEVLPEGGSKLVIAELDGVEKYFDVTMNGGRGPDPVLLRERRRESRLTVHGAPVLRFSYGEVLDVAMFDRLLTTFGVPRVQEPSIRVSRLRTWVP